MSGERHPYDGGIAGWLYPEEVQWLRTQARSRWRILEIGVYKGRGTWALATSTPGKVWSVDHWLGSGPRDCVTDEIGRWGGPNAVYDEFLQNCGQLGNLTVMRMSSAEAWRRLGHLRFDFVWIDGAHNYPAVKDDILRWRAYLSPGGLLAGHDGEYKDVARAVKELVPGYRTVQNHDSIIWWSDGSQ